MKNKIGMPMLVPSDGPSSYDLLLVEPGKSGSIIVTNRRTNAMGEVSYAVREYAKNHTFRYLAEGKSALTDKHETGDFLSLADSSISADIYACVLAIDRNHN